MLEHLNACNDVVITSVYDGVFDTFGKVIEGLDISAVCAYMKTHTSIPPDGNLYVASDPVLEAFDVCEKIGSTLYGEMPIQVGYCNGKNTTYNGFEYHKGSEINIAVSDFCLVLGHTWQIKRNRFYVGDEQVFYVPQGTVIELYQTTLHLSPCAVRESGYQNIVILPRGTNTPLSHKPEHASGENLLLLQKNKWVIAHPQREPLMQQGAYPGLIGENKQIHY